MLFNDQSMACDCIVIDFLSAVNRMNHSAGLWRYNVSVSPLSVEPAGHKSGKNGDVYTQHMPEAIYEQRNHFYFP